jgi:VWFA-related protein
MFIDARLGCLLLVTLLYTAAASAQQSRPPAQPGNGRIYLDVVVTPKSGPAVTGLQQQDFTLLDNKAPQTVTSFETVTGREAPIEVILVIDAVNTTAQNVSYERIEIDKFLRAEGGHLAYPIALAVFTDSGIQILGEFLSDGNALSASLDRNDVGLRTIGRSAGLSGEAERWKLSLAALRQLVASEASRPGRKVVLWVYSRLASPVRPKHPARLESAATGLRGYCESLDSAPAGPRHALRHRSSRIWRVYDAHLVL